MTFQNDFDKLLGKRILSQSYKASTEKSIVETPKVTNSSVTTNNSKSRKVQTTVTSAQRNASPRRTLSPNKSSSSTKSTMNKKTNEK